MIVKNGKELDSLYVEDKEIVAVMYGDKMVWEGGKAIPLGSGLSFNLSSYSGYQNFTADNFFCTKPDGYYVMSVLQDQVKTFTTTTVKSYDSSTGVLSFYQNTTGSNTSQKGMYAYLIKNPNRLQKIANAGTSSSAITFNIASILPDVYTELTEDNFMCKAFPEGYSRNTCYVSSCSQAVNRVYKEYNSSTGILTFYIQSNQSTGSYNIANKNPDIYYVPKIEV